MSRIAQHFYRPMVQAGAAACGCNQRSAVYFGLHAQHALATGWLFNSLADLGDAETANIPFLDGTGGRITSLLRVCVAWPHGTCNA